MTLVMIKKHIFLTLFILASLSYPLMVWAQQGMPQHVRVTITPERTAVTPGDTIYIAIAQDIDPGWHTYWINPGDSGQAMFVTWTLPAGFEIGKTHWPAPEKVMIGPMASYGYHDKTVILQELAVPESLPSGPLTLKAEAVVLVCKDICIPETTTREITLNAAAADNSAVIDAALDQMPQWLDWPASYREENGTFEVALELFMKPFADRIDMNHPLILMPEAWGLVDSSAETKAEIIGEKLILRQKRGAHPLKDVGNATFILRYTDINGGDQTAAFAAAPEKTQKNEIIAPAPDSSRPVPEDLKVMNIRSQSGIITQTEQKLSLPLALVFALIGGLILNLMPCVFPVLSLKALKLCKLSGSEINHARLHGLLYTAGVVVSFAVLAATLIVLQAAGEEIGWGFQLQNPLFVLLLSWLLFAVGLNLSGFFEFGGGLGNIGAALVRGHSYAASFFTGVLAALVATPCTAPFMAAAIGYALTQTPASAMAIFMTLGFGLALPYLLLCFIPALRGILPRPGAWMETFRQLLAFPLYASAAWLVWVYSMQGGALNVLIALTGGVLIVFAVWLFKKTKNFWRGAGLFFSSVMFVLLIANAALQPEPALQPMAPEEGWIPYMREDFTAREAGNDALFVNMTAAWCITCKVNERVLEAQAVRAMFEKHNITSVRGDWTNRNPEITEFLLRYGRNGVPIYIYYAPRDSVTGKRPDPVMLPQILTPGIVIEAIEK